MEVTADFSETDALKLKKNQGATVTLNAESSTILNAKVVSVSSLPVSSSSSSGGSSSSAVEYEAVLRITSNTSGLRTGLSATVAVATGEADNALYLPTAAVTGTGTTRTVQLVNADGSTTTTSVTVGVEGTSGIQIVSGLTEGQKVKETTVSQSSNNGFPGGGGAGGGFGGGAAGGGGARPGGGGN
jgi:macrolide-specific efflux system membrane fusion protein